MDRETSVSSTGFPSAPGSISATPSPFITKSEPVKSSDGGPGEIYGLSAGNVPVSRPPSSLASSGVEEVSGTELKETMGGKRSAEDEADGVDGDGKSKKRRIDLTRGS